MVTSPNHSRFTFLRMITLLLVLASALLFSGQQTHAAPAYGGVGSCSSISVTHIALGDGQPSNNAIYGELCNPVGGPGQAVLLLLHGSTYSHLYWDWPLSPNEYSAVHSFTAAGYSTFNIDRIGVGNSSHPPSSAVTIASNAYVVHTLVGRLKTGAIGGTPFSNVVLIGHSLGANIAISEVSSYHDVTAVALTGYTHILNPSTVSFLQSRIIPAYLDPSGRFATLDSGYLTTTTGTNGPAYYYEPGTYSDPAMITYDEQNKQTITQSEVTDLLNFPSTLTAQIPVPVLEVVGQDDIVVCGTGAVDCSSNSSVYNEEAPYFSPAAQLQVQTITNTGHTLNVHPTAQSTYNAIIAWLPIEILPCTQTSPLTCG